MELFNTLLGKISDIVWGPPLLVFLVGTGIYISFKISFLQFSLLPYALKLAFSKSEVVEKEDGKTENEGDVSHFQALMTALAATIGTGNIAGVATAIVAGGPGAVIWMQVTAIFGMATKYAEAILAVKYREKDSNGEMAGGPMYYLAKGLNMPKMGWLFAFFGTVAAFGIGNMVQANAVALSVKQSFGVEPWVTGLVMAIFTGLVVLGGIKSIGRITGILVPFMACFYVIGGLAIILLNIERLPEAISVIWSDAFTGKAVAGGAIGTVIRYGVARGVFSNEAGLGSAPIAAAAAKTDVPARQALVSMTGTFLDTIVVCSITALVVVMSGLWQDGTINGAALTTLAFEQLMPGPGGWIVTIGLILFAYSTILGWCYYGEKCLAYLAGDKAIFAFRCLFSVFVLIGSVSSLTIVWNIADVFNGLMAIPNLIGLVGLTPVVVAETKSFFKLREEETKLYLDDLAVNKN